MKRWLAIAVVVLLLVGVGLSRYHRQARSYVTHWQGSPSHTVAYVPPEDDPALVRIAVAGDVGAAGRRLDSTAAAMARVAGKRGFDALLLLGDNVYPGGDPAKLPSTVFEPFGPLLRRGTRLLAILGNHDVKNGNGPRQVEALGMPGRWWAATLGDAEIVGLDSNELENPQQLRWAATTLCRTTSTWTIVALHHPPYSAGYQGSNLSSRRALEQLLPGTGVELVLSGHDHDYQRSRPIDGVTYVVSGAAAETRRTGHFDYTVTSFSWHHFVELDVYPDRMVGRAVNESGRVADTWTLHPRPNRDGCPAGK